MSQTQSQLRMEKLRAAVAAKQVSTTGNSSASADKSLYKFYDAPTGSTSVLRLLPDADEDNPFFWVEKQVITLPFGGVVGSTEFDETTAVTVRVPCNNMFEPKTCPIVKAIAPWWKDPAKVDLARTYYKKSTFYYNAFIVKSGFKEEETPENPIRRVQFTNQIHKIIEASTQDPEFIDFPVDYTNGVDFNIKKTQKGTHADYSTSSWARNSRTLSEDELSAIATYGLLDLKKFKGPQPTSDQLLMIKQMFQDSLSGLPFDMASYGEFARPYAARQEGFVGSGVANSFKKVSSYSDDTEEETRTVVTPAKASDTNALLARLKGNLAQKG